MAFIQVPPHKAFGSQTQSTAQIKSEHPIIDRLTKSLPSIPLPMKDVSSPSLIVPIPISPAAFAPFGHLIQAYPDSNSRPASIDAQPSPDGKTVKYTRLADILHTYPQGSGPVTGIAVYRATPKVGLIRGEVFDVRYMERHPYTTQAFIPMGKAEVRKCID